MFTGIIQAVGRVRSLQPTGGDTRLEIDAGALDLGDVALGDSIAVSGPCLTVVRLGAGSFAADVSSETLARTTLGRLRAGAPVNLEKALAVGERLGGHLVSGHVDGVGEVVERRADARSVRFVVRLPHELGRYVAAKGSVTIEGVSLTVNGIDEDRFDVNIIPHTLEQTTLSALRPGGRVNIEVDIISRYLERLIGGGSRASLADLLSRHGFTDP